VYEVNGLPSLEWRARHPAMTERTERILAAWEARCLARADRVVCPSRVLAAHLMASAERAGGAAAARALAARLRVIPNGYVPLDAAERARLAAVPRATGPLALVYVGTLSPWQGLAWLLRALAPLAGRFRLEVIAPLGDRFRAKAQRTARRAGLAPYVTWSEPVPQAELTARLARADVGVAPLLPVPRNLVQGCYPLKLVDYVRAGLPVLAAELACTREVLAGAAGTTWHAAGSSEALRAAVTRLAGDVATLRATPRGDVAQAGLLDWRAAGAALRAVYDEVLGERVDVAV
jgi:glycosyltransferase involved in cell wall biosynthesis